MGDPERPAAFLTDLDVRELWTGRKRLLAPLAFYSAILRGELVAPTGFESDYASSPRPFWNIVPKDGPWTWAAVLHDAAYQGMLRTNSGETIHLIKPLADDLFREAMSVAPCNDVPGWKRWIMYRLVRVFGGRMYQGLGAVTA